MIQGGKCSNCRKRISIDHFFAEFGCGLLFLASYLYCGIGYNFYILCIISSLLIIIFVSDFKYMIILDSPLIISSILILILKYIYFGLESILPALLSGLFMMTAMLLVGQFGKLVFKKESLGGGDIKFSFIIGLILEIKLGLISLILSTFLALPYAIGTILFNKDHEFPYGPFLVGALFITFMFIEKFSYSIDLLFRFF